MNIKDLMDKSELAQYNILSVLYNKNTSLSLKKLSEETQLSKATIIKYIDYINELMLKEDIGCEVKINYDVISLKLEEECTWKKIVGVLLHNSPKYKIILYLYKSYSFTIPALSQHLLVSEPTLNRYLASLNKSLFEFGISIKNGKLVGEEVYIRNFYYELFWNVWTKEEITKYLDYYDIEKAIRMLEGVCRFSLKSEQILQFQLWFLITQERFKVKNKKNKMLLSKMTAYEDNVFYLRLNKALFHYFSGYAVEFDKTESMLLFSFLVSYYILPVETMEYILGFGGPVSERITHLINTKRKKGLVLEITHEQVIYSLSQLLWKSYFFKSKIIMHTTSDFLLKKTKKYEDILKDLKKLVITEMEISVAMETMVDSELRRLLIFLEGRRNQTLKVALDLESNHLNQYLWNYLILEKLNNNKLIELFNYNKSDYYDCIISELFFENYDNIPVYRIKQSFSSRDFLEIERFLNEQLLKKHLL